MNEHEIHCRILRNSQMTLTLDSGTRERKDFMKTGENGEFGE